MPKISDGRLALGLFAAFAFWLFAVLPFLYGPPPRFAETSSPPKTHSDQAGQRSAAKPDGSISAPFFIRIPKTAEETAEEAEDRNEKASTDRWLMIFTGAVALFTLLLVWATVLLYRAGERQLKLATKTAERQLRAYAFVRPTHIHIDGASNKIAVQYVVGNTGQTPAYKVRHASIVEIWPYPLPKTFEVVSPANFEGGMSVGNSVTIGGEASRGATGDITSLKKEGKRIYVVVVAKYFDAISKNERTTRLCAAVANLEEVMHAVAATPDDGSGRKNLPQIEFEYTTQHNDSD
jgi:hypothetical protein